MTDRWKHKAVQWTLQTRDAKQRQVCAFFPQRWCQLYFSLDSIENSNMFDVRIFNMLKSIGFFFIFISKCDDINIQILFVNIFYYTAGYASKLLLLITFLISPIAGLCAMNNLYRQKCLKCTQVPYSSWSEYIESYMTTPDQMSSRSKLIINYLDQPNSIFKW